MTRRLAATIGLLAGLIPVWGHAQTNIDQGKTPAQMFVAACAECHKATRALATGKNSGTLTDFLQEHYTTSRSQAASLAAYVLSMRGADSGAAVQGRGQRPTVARTTPAEQAKPPRTQARQPGKPEEAAPAAAKPRHERPATAARNRRKEPNAPPSMEPAAVTHEPAAVVAAPAAPTDTPSREASPAPAAAAPPADASGTGESVPRDNIPD